MAEYYLPEGMPLPGWTPDSPDAGFWEACRRHELVVQQCSDCKAFRHTPEILCYLCHSFNYEWFKTSGKGVVYSYMNSEYPVHPVLRDRVPYNVALVEIPEAGNVRMVGNIVDADYDDIYIGMPVEVYFEDHTEEEVTLPLWKRADK